MSQGPHRIVANYQLRNGHEAEKSEYYPLSRVLFADRRIDLGMAYIDVADTIPAYQFRVAANPISQNLIVIGHPEGKPKMVADNCKIEALNHDVTFDDRCDTFSGNSGSPEFDASSHGLSGLLLRGQLDRDRDGQIIVYNSGGQSVLDIALLDSVIRGVIMGQRPSYLTRSKRKLFYTDIALELQCLIAASCQSTFDWIERAIKGRHADLLELIPTREVIHESKLEIAIDDRFQTAQLYFGMIGLPKSVAEPNVVASLAGWLQYRFAANKIAQSVSDRATLTCARSLDFETCVEGLRNVAGVIITKKISLKNKGREVVLCGPKQDLFSCTVKTNATSEEIETALNGL
jgi:hypothetical protein